VEGSHRQKLLKHQGGCTCMAAMLMVCTMSARPEDP
jgi:hypothetical protein